MQRPLSSPTFPRKAEGFVPTLLLGSLIAFTSACSPTYPEKDLSHSIQKLFKKELGVPVRTALIGKTLYVSFEVENMVTANLDLPRDVTEKLEDAMISISRIALSTDADIDITVIEAQDLTWGVETIVVRRMDDLKGLFYWKISKTDFDERLILETGKIAQKDGIPEADWHDITLPEFMARWIASRINLGTRANPFLNVLLGIEKMTADYDPDRRSLDLIIKTSSKFSSTSTSTVALALLRGSVIEQAQQVEKKYLRDLSDGEDWARGLTVRDSNGATLLEIQREEWIRKGEKTAGNGEDPAQTKW